MWKEGPLSGFAGNDRFVLHRALGSGAFGTVYEAFDVQAERTVALKTLHALTPDTLYRFKREFRALNDLEHPNLVRLYDLLQVDGTWLFTMELLQGDTFLDYVRPFGKLDVDRLRRALAQLADGLEALHATGHLHRDIKPSNVLVTHADERLVLLDFGLITDDDAGASRDGLGGIVGTPAYMAPEQAGQQALAPAADWYAVGAMLFEALTGRPPFEGKAMKILVDKMRQDAPAPGTLRRVPADLDNLCRALLARDPEERPAAQRVRAWALGAAVATPAASVEQAPIFVGRADERAALDDALADARRGRPARVHLVGPSGVGKSALLQAFLRDVREAPPAPLVLHGRCYARESVPYKAFDALIDRLTRHLLSLSDTALMRLVPEDVGPLVRLFPVLARVPLLAAADPRDGLEPVTRRRRAFAALRTLFVRLAADQPVVVALDDLHWADADSALLFEDVFAGPEPPPLLMVGSYRGAGYEQSAFLARFRTAGGRVVRITPLDVDTGAALARALLGADADPAVAQRIAERAAGHPLHIAELARHAEPTAASEDTRLEAVLTRRFDRLAPVERRLLELGAVAGGPLDRGVAARAAGLSDAAAREALDQLIRDELLRAVPPAAVEVFHDSIRLAVTTVLEARAAQDLHQRLATALIELDAPGDDRLAYHLQRAGQAQDAAPYVLRAAEQATRALAFDRAVVLYERALEVGRDVDARGVPLRERLADALTNAGRYADAARVYLELAAQAPPERALTLRERAADRFLRSGRLAEGRGVLNEVLAAVGMALPESPFGALLSVAWRRLRLKLRGLRFRARDAAAIPTAALRRVDVAFSVGEGLAPIDLLRGVDFQTRSLLLALKAGDPFRVARSMGVEAVSLATLGPAGRRESARLVERAREICPDNAEVDAIGHVADVLAAWHSNRWADAVAGAERALAGFEAQGEGKQWERMMADMFGLAARWWLGDLIAFRAMVRERVADARARGELLAELHYSNAMLFPPTLLDGDPERADREIVDVHNRWRQPVVGLPDFYALLSRMNVALYRGRGHDALALAAADVDRLRRLGLHRIPMLQMTLIEVQARATLAAWAEGGDAQKLGRAFGRLRRELGRLPVPWVDAAGPLLDAQRATLAGDAAAAGAAYAAGRGAFERLQMPVFALATRAATGGDEGRAALDAMRARGVAEPVAYVRMLVPAARTG